MGFHLPTENFLFGVPGADLNPLSAEKVFGSYTVASLVMMLRISGYGLKNFVAVLSELIG